MVARAQNDGIARLRAMSDAELVDELMLDLMTAGDFGLWELVGAWPGLDDRGEVLQRMRGLVRNLVERGWVDLCEGAMTYVPGEKAECGPLTRVRQETALSVLSDDAHWDYERIWDASIRYFLLATDRGTQEWREGAARRGLLGSP